MILEEQAVQGWRKAPGGWGLILLACSCVMALGFFGPEVSPSPAAGGGWARGLRTEAAASEQVRPWHFKKLLGARTVEVAVSWTACRRHPAATIKKQIVERPGRAIITTTVNVPTPPAGTACLRLRSKRNIRVQLERPVSQLRLYDGSYSPPKLRWPRGG